MARVIIEAETQEQAAASPAVDSSPTTREEAIAMAAPGVGRAVHARALVAFTETGTSARLGPAVRPHWSPARTTSSPDVKAEMTRRDPERRHTWVVVTDGERALQRRVAKNFTDVTLVLACT
ncbi:MAG: hypothetical protein M3P85_12595 [Actinomycetota bacterium]|nr:hypothetical protein [Actinomycetota bacterium]